MVLLRASVVVVIEPLSVVPDVTLPALFCSSVVPVPVVWLVLDAPLTPVLDGVVLDVFEPFALVVPSEPLLVVPDVTSPLLFFSNVVPAPVVPVVVVVVDRLPVEFVVLCWAETDPATSRTAAKVASAFFIGVELVSYITLHNHRGLKKGECSLAAAYRLRVKSAAA